MITWNNNWIILKLSKPDQYEYYLRSNHIIKYWLWQFAVKVDVQYLNYLLEFMNSKWWMLELTLLKLCNFWNALLIDGFILNRFMFCSPLKNDSMK